MEFVEPLPVINPSSLNSSSNVKLNTCPMLVVYSLVPRLILPIALKASTEYDAPAIPGASSKSVPFAERSTTPAVSDNTAGSPITTDGTSVISGLLRSKSSSTREFLLMS